MKFNFKKISAVLASGIMIVSGVGFAAAASFPAPFSDGQAAGTAIVVGSAATMDLDASITIDQYLKTKVKSEGGTPEGESFKIEKPSTKLNVGNGTSDVWGSAITKADLPTILADGIFNNKQNNEYKYTQQVNMGNLAFNHFRDAEFNNNAPLLGFNVTSQTTVLNYTLDFTTDPQATKAGSSGDLTDFEGKNIQMLGKNYYILDFKNATAKITFLDSATTENLAEVETKTVVMDGKSYEVSIFFISDDQTILTVNGENTEKLSATGTTYGNTYKLSDGTYVGVKNINVQNYQGGTKNVEFSLGTGKLEVTDGSSGGTVKINDKIITDLTGFVILSQSGTYQTWQKLVLQWKVDDKKFLSTDSELVMPGFEAIKFSMTDISGLATPEKTEVVTSGNSYVSLKTQIKDGELNLPLFYVSTATDSVQGNLSGLGESSSQRLASSNTTGLWYHYLLNGDNFEKGFIASWASSKDFESYYLRFSNIHNDASDARNYTDLTNIITGGTVCSNLYDGQTCNLGSMTFTINTVVWNASDKWVNVSVNSGGSFNKLYTAKGLTVYLPYPAASGVTNSAKGAFNSRLTSAGFTNAGTGQVYNLTQRFGINVSDAGPWALWFGEQDQYGTLDLKAFNMTIDGTGGTASSRQTTVVSVDANNIGKFYETSSGSKLWEAYKVSQLATKIRWDKTSSNYNSASLEYHPSEVYASVFITSPSATTVVGNMLFKDNEKASWQDRNVVLVGGSCINSATAEKLGGAKCAEEFASATGAGAGQFLIQTFDGFTTGKVAVVVAGYEATDTLAAANYLKGATDLDTAVGKKYVGTVAQGGTSTVVAA